VDPALVNPFPEPETRIFVVCLYVLLGLTSAYQLHRLVWAIVQPLERTYEKPMLYVPLYPGDTPRNVEIIHGRGLKVVMIIVLSVNALIYMGGMYVALAAGYRLGYIEFVGWNNLSHNLLLAAHMLWPVVLWALAIVRAKPGAVIAA
jgi:hypothetical protein